MLKKFKKGFTLTELIVVIVIIGVLAAVLIPTLAGYVEKAKASNDNSEAKSMSNILQYEAMIEGVDSFDVFKVKQILTRSNFSFDCRSKGNGFWYNKDTNRIVVQSLASVLGNTVSADSGTTQREIEAISDQYPNLLYMTKTDKIGQAIEYIRNFADEVEQENSVFDAKLTEFVEDEKVLNYLKQFSPDRTLYISNDGYCINTTSTHKVVENIVFSSNISTIPALPSFMPKSDSYTLTLPQTITYVQEGAFSNIKFNMNIVCDYTNVVFEQGSMSQQLKACNPLIKEGTKISFFDCFNIDYENGDRLYYYYNSNNELVSGTYVVDSSLRDSDDLTAVPENIYKMILLPNISLNNRYGNIYQMELSRKTIDNMIVYYCKLYDENGSIYGIFKENISIVDMNTSVNEGVLTYTMPFEDGKMLDYNYSDLKLSIENNEYEITSSATIENYDDTKEYKIQLKYNNIVIFEKII